MGKAYLTDPQNTLDQTGRSKGIQLASVRRGGETRYQMDLTRNRVRQVQDLNLHGPQTPDSVSKDTRRYRGPQQVAVSPISILLFLSISLARHEGSLGPLRSLRS